jgi:DNA topoisomerase-1
LACTGFPECRFTKSLSGGNNQNNTGQKCPKCQQGEVVLKRTKKRRIFYGCSRWPDCDFASWKKPGENE